MHSRRKGFTLIELIIALIMIGILASIAGPMMSGLQDRAIKTEAIVGLSAILNAWKQHILETGDESIVMYTPDNEWHPGDPVNPIGNILPPNQLDGVYFQKNCYGLMGEYRDVWFLWCMPSLSTNPRVQNFKPIQMDIKGRAWQGVIDYGHGYYDALPKDRLN